MGTRVEKHRIGDRVVVSSFIACGRCWYCDQDLYSLCDNANPNPGLAEGIFGQALGGCFGYTHAMGGHHGSHVQGVYDQVKQQLRMQNGRPTAVRQAIDACRKGGSVFVLGVFAGAVDTFPLGQVIDKGLTLAGAQMHGPRYIPMLLDRMANGEISTSHLAAHTFSLDEAFAPTRCSRRRRTVAYGPSSPCERRPTRLRRSIGGSVGAAP